ncbi:MAG TPA: hypothetical protein VLC46_24225, partial [Thermoanaerobaculia bacterium]|nr:hypothetical protein [Thermoanaerobaculia bacterium]
SRGTIKGVMKQRPAEVEEKVELTAEELAELDERADAVERGEFVDGDEVIRRLRSGYEFPVTFDLSPEEEGELDAAIAEADAGLLTPLEEVLRRMHENN